MPTDECRYDFDTLTRDVLPERMCALREHMQNPIAMQEFAVRGDGPKTIAKRHGFASDISGCYVLLDAGTPVYVGISRHVFERLAGHVGRGGHWTATLSYRMAARDAPHNTTAVKAMANPEFRAVFDRRREYLLSLQVAVVEILNPLVLYVFAAYAAVPYGFLMSWRKGGEDPRK